MSRFLAVSVAFAVALAVPTTTRAQWGDFLKDKLDEAARRKTGEAIDQAADSGVDAAKRKATQGADEAEEEEEQPRPKKKRAQRAEAEEPGEERSAAPAKRAAATSADAPKPVEDVAAGEVYGNRFDFVPGDKLVVFDDFSDTDAGDYPKRWTLGQGGGPIEVAEIQGKRWFMAIADEGGEGMRDTTSFLRADLKKELPEKFTVELDVPSTGNACVIFTDKYWATGQDSLCWTPTTAEMYWASIRNDNVAKSTKPIRHVSIAVSGTNIKVYFDGQRVLQHPDGVRVREESKGIRTIGITFPNDERKRNDFRITNFKLAAGGKDYAKELVAGRIVTHGITFDTGSDVIKPESGPTLRGILKLMQDNPSLRFEVQGHTDDRGAPAVNGPLSDRRAAAVRTWLVGQGVDAKRLQSKGLGATKPMDTNATQEGRANNRRVEFVKLTATS